MNILNKCSSCIHFNNEEFANKNFGYCPKLFHQLHCENKEGDILNDDKIVTNVDFGCILFETNNDE